VDFLHVRDGGREGPILADWRPAYYYIIAAKLKERGITSQSAAFTYFRSAAEAIGDPTISQDAFGEAIRELGMTGEKTVGLTVPEIAELHASLSQPLSSLPKAGKRARIEDIEDTKEPESQQTGIQSKDMVDDHNDDGATEYEFKAKVDIESFDSLYATIAAEMGIAEKPWHASLLIAAAAMLPSPQQTKASGIPHIHPPVTTSVGSMESELKDQCVGAVASSCAHSVDCTTAWLEPASMENDHWDHSWNLSDHTLVAAELRLVDRVH